MGVVRWLELVIGGCQVEGGSAAAQTLHSSNNIIEGLKFKLLSAKTLQLN